MDAVSKVYTRTQDPRNNFGKNFVWEERAIPEGALRAGQYIILSRS